MRKERNKNRKYLRIFITVLFIVWLITLSASMYLNREENVQIINDSQKTTAKKYIISREAELRRIRACNKTVTLEHEYSKEDTYVDINWAGERHTKLTVYAFCSLGFDGYDIDITHIDQKNGIMYVKLGNPILIGLDIPYDKINFDKTEGLFRFSMSEKEQKNFYKTVKDNMRVKLLRDKNVMEQADALNKKVVTYTFKLNPNVKGVIFE